MDAEGIPPAKLYYDKFKCTFTRLVDPNYALGFGVIPHAIFVNEHGVVLDHRAKKSWKSLLKDPKELKPVTNEIRAKWSDPGARLKPDAIARLEAKQKAEPGDLAVADELASCYNALKRHADARKVLLEAVKLHDPKKTAKAGGKNAKLLGQAHFQLARAFEGDRKKQVEHATLSYYLSPTIGFGKQIARIIDPAKFDGTKNGRLDNRFREGTLQRLRKERKEWLAQ